MKKLLAILMCAALLVSLAACGSETPENNGGTNGDVNTNTETIEPVKKEISRGTISGDVYTNDFVGFTFTKPADWSFLSDEEIAERMNTTLEVFDYNSVQEALAETATMYDMYAGDAYGNNINIIYENTMLTAMKKLTMDEYIDAFQKQFDSLEGYDYEIVSTEEVTLGDATFTKLTSILTVGTQEVNQACYIKIVDEYVITITVTPTTETIDSIEAMFG